MVDFDTASKLIEKGLGVASFLVLVWMIYKFLPILTQVKEQQAALTLQNQEVIRNNTLAIQEQAKANDNVATALKLISASNTTVAESLERHDRRAEHMALTLAKVESNMDHLTK